MASWCPARAACALALPLLALVLSGCDAPASSSGSVCGPKPTATPQGGLATEDEYRYFFCSAEGLSWGKNKAKSIAKRELANLRACNITIAALTDLKAACNDLTRKSKLPDWKLPDTFLRLAYQHVNHPKPKNPEYSMLDLYKVLVDGGVASSMAQNYTVQLVLQHASSQQLDAAYKAMLSNFFKLDKSAAMGAAVSLSKAGADVSKCKAGDKFEKCSQTAVNLNLDGIPKRYADDGKLYAAWEFVTYYAASDSWLDEWNASPEEKRFIPNDQVAYTAVEFFDFFGASWETKWQTATVATQQRIAKDGKIYTMPEFVDYYKGRGDWRSEWQEAPEVMCRECKPFDAAAVSDPALLRAAALLV